ncbi:DiGeorge syndrome critical region protein 14 [Mortierella sp. AD011]|nr:DiGeorge syndrome critical region protein 14 [Mortierella sp. AD010]KAF9403045.1 DiGeorge syndrome critical region protein 14 [Mortierella sp. AD011]
MSLVKTSVDNNNSSNNNNSTSSSSSSVVKATKQYQSNIPVLPPKQILEEDEYIEALSKIIERDFFPDLAKLKRQHAYLEAVEMNDVQRIHATAREIAGNDTPLGLRRLRTPAQTPKLLKAGLPDESWTPARVDAESATPTWHDAINKAHKDLDAADTPIMDTPTVNNMRKRPAKSQDVPEKDTIDTSLSLDQFQARYTSEDNASFNEILEKINAQRKLKHRWIYDQEKKQMKFIESSRAPDQKLLRQAGEVDDGDVSSSSVQEGEVSKLALMVSDKRTGVIPTWEYKAKNTLMYQPEGLGTTLNLDTARGKPKEIVHRNTGFQGQDLLVVNQKAAAKVNPKTCVFNPSRLTRVYIALPDLDEESTDSPKVRGFSFVSSTPSPSMSQMGDDPELMTWGTIEDEPLLISSGFSDSGPSPFKLPPTPRRELIAQKLTEKSSKRFRENSNVFTSPSISALSQYHDAIGGSTPTPRFNSPYAAVAGTPLGRTPGSSKSRSITSRNVAASPRARAEMLSPAAQILLNRAKVSRVGGADEQLRSSYGSTPRVESNRVGGNRHASVTPSPLTRK